MYSFIITKTTTDNTSSSSHLHSSTDSNKTQLSQTSRPPQIFTPSFSLPASSHTSIPSQAQVSNAGNPSQATSSRGLPPSLNPRSMESTLTDGSCSCGKSAVGGEQMTCLNVTSSFFRQVHLNLTRTHWFVCTNCVLSTLLEDTFLFSRNNISYLSLNSTRIHYVGNYAFSKFPLLKTLDLKDNLIDTIEARGFAGAKRLIHLNLSQNRLKKLFAGVFAELENLDVLNLRENSISSMETEAFLGLVNLKYLYLNGNKLKELQPENFQYLSSLKILNLDDNVIEEVEPSNFAHLRHLNHLYLNNNSISYLVQYSFKELTSLIELQLRHNNLTKIQTSAFNGLRNIKYLYLSGNNLEIIKPYGFVGLDSLLILDLMHNKFINFSLDYLNGMQYLTALWLQGNLVSNLTVTKNSDVLRSLRVLDLKDNKLQTLNFKFVHEKMPKIEQILVGNNLWKCGFIVQMYEYFSAINVTLCLDHNCKTNETELFIQDVCDAILTSTEPDVPSDFVLDRTAVVSYSYWLIFVNVIFIFSRDG